MVGLYLSGIVCRYGEGFIFVLNFVGWFVVGWVLGFRFCLLFLELLEGFANFLRWGLIVGVCC